MLPRILSTCIKTIKNTSCFHKTNYLCYNITSNVQYPSIKNIHTTHSRCFNAERYITGREEKFRIEDGVPENWQMIYRGPFYNYVMALHSISLASLAGIFGIAAYQINNPISGGDHLITVDMIAQQLTQFSNLEMNIFLGSLLSFNILAQFVIKEYVIRVYQNDDEYKLILFGLLPWMRRTVEIKMGDVAEYKSLPTIPWRNHRYVAKKKVLIFLEDYFKTPSHFYAMLASKDK